MTLPASGAISLGDVLNELKIANSSRALPISLGDSDVIALAGKSALPVSLSDLYGKSAIPPIVVTGISDSNSVSSATGTTVSCHPSATYTGGQGAPSFLWEFVSNPDVCALANATSQTCTVSHAYAHNDSGSVSATLKCTVTAGPGPSSSANANASLAWAP